MSILDKSGEIKMIKIKMPVTVQLSFLPKTKTIQQQ